MPEAVNHDKKAYMLQYRADNIDRILAREADYRLKNPEKIKASRDKSLVKKDAKIAAFRNTVRVCDACFKPLELTNTRDIARKKFCSISCRNSASAKKRIFASPIKACITCGKDFKTNSTTHKYCSPKCSANKAVGRSYKSLDGNPRGYIMHLICKPGRKHLQIEDMLQLLAAQNGKCAITGIELTFTKKYDGIKIHTNLSIDQIVAGKGYDIDNIQFVCAVVNVMKTTLSMVDFRWWCLKIVEGGT